MRRIIIFGSVGSGKSTLGTALGAILGLPVIHLDEIVWQPGCRTIPDDEFFRVHTTLLALDRWIIEGSGPWPTWQERIVAADTIILPDYSLGRTWYWVLKRQATALLRGRPTQPADCPPLSMTAKLLRWAWVYRREMRPAFLRLIERAGADTKTILLLRSPAMMHRFLRELRGVSIDGPSQLIA